MKKSDYDHWWETVGSALAPLPGYDMEEHARTVARVAFWAGWRVALSSINVEEEDHDDELNHLPF